MKFIYKDETLEKVIDKACDEINIDPEYLHYHVVKEEKDGVSIECYTITEVIDYAQDYILQIIKDYGLEAKATTTLNDGVIRITIDASHNSVLIGKNGKTLTALNNMVRSAVFTYFQERYKILLDINDYKDEKYEKILRIAKKVARDVQNSHVTATLDPMTSDERRVVHNALSNYHNIKTESSGKGPKRAVSIYYLTDEEYIKHQEAKQNNEEI